MFAHFEHEVHEKVEAGVGLNFDKLNEIYGSLKDKYYEPAVVDDRIKSEWMRIPHLYRAYYVYQYSTGVSASLALSKQVLEGGQPVADRYLDLLKAGSSKYPLSALEDAGVDMSRPDPVKQALSMYEKYLNQMEELI